MTALQDLVRTVHDETAHAADGILRSDAQATNSAAQRALYVSRVPVHPKKVSGTFRRLKWAALTVMLGLYYLLPWMRWDRGPNSPDQAVLADVANGRLYFFWIEIWPQEVYYITGLLIMAAVFLFLVTALFGRVWCGYACPQTVWTDLFILVERWIEGDRNARIKLDKSNWTIAKLAKRATKHAVWLVIAAATGGAWILYFHDAPSLAAEFFTGQAPVSAYAFAGILTFTTYSLAGLMREQVCTYMCPWPRIQAALIDVETLQVTYRTDRGEARGPHKKGQSWEGRGHCIDCRQCVAACPMGIDIRDGSQLECINCALCIDACDEVMVKVGLPKGLIAYDTDLNIARRQAGERQRFTLIRARTVLYAVVLVLVGGGILAALAARSTIDLNVLRDRNPTYVRLSDGSIRNAYTVKILNRTNDEETYVITVEGLPSAEIKAVGVEQLGPDLAVTGAPDAVRDVRVLVTVPPAALTADSMPVTVRVKAASGAEAANDTVFLSGAMK